MPDNVHTAFNAPFAKVVQAHFTNNYKQPIFIGTSVVKGGYYKYTDYFQDYDNFFVFDYSSFDSRIPRVVLQGAFTIVAIMFSEAYNHSTLMKIMVFIVSGYLDSTILAPGRRVFVKTRGTPSGSPWTSIINSLSNWIMVTSIFRKCKDYRCVSYKLSIQGDDIVVGTKGGFFSTRDSVNKFLNRLSSIYGCTIKPSSIMMSKSLFTPRIDQAINFLGNYYVLGFPVRHVDDYLEMLYCPRRKIKSAEDRLNRVRAYLIMCPFDCEASILCQKFLKYIYIRDWGMHEDVASELVRITIYTGLDLLSNPASVYVDMRAEAMGLRNHLNPWQMLKPNNRSLSASRGLLYRYLGHYVSDTYCTRKYKKSMKPLAYRFCALPCTWL
jgi:hypothetical protein